jgi:hypothetical protein
MMRAADLLAGPRGRRLCLEFAQRWWAPDSDALSELLQAVGHASNTLATNPGILYTLSSFDAATPAAVPEIPIVTASDVARLLDTAEVAAPTVATLNLALGMVVGNARYWQEPDGADVLCATPEVRAALHRFAEMIANAPAAAQWSAPIDMTGQWEVTFDSSVSAISSETSPARERLSTWRDGQIDEEITAQRERPSDPTARWSGTWWSAPVLRATSTTRAVSGLDPLGLWLVEDGLGSEWATVERVHVPDWVRVYEIDSADAWAQLCRQYPLEVTASRRHDWYRATGRAGEWVIPDWSLVAHDYEAVHLTVAGYLAAAGVAIAVDDARASVIAGWDPDKTYWLFDMAREPGSTQYWQFDPDDDSWVQRDAT